jgi:hypothetical protein
MAGDPKSGSKAPSFYSAAAEMPPGGGKAAPKPPGAETGAEETKIVATLLEVLDKWDKLTKDPKRKEKIQQIATIAKEIQSGMGGSDKPMGSESTTPAPDAMGAGGAGGAAGGGAGAGAGAPPPPPPM